MSILDDLDEELEPRPAPAPPDFIGDAVGAKTYVRSHRFADLHIEYAMGRSPRLAVSRYYWELEPPVAVDYRRELRYGQQEYETKRAYFKERGIVYLLVQDQWDGTGARAALARYAQKPQAGAEAGPLVASAAPAPPPLTAPRPKPQRQEPSPPLPPVPTDAQLCACGCGELAKPGNKFISGHNMKKPVK